jgi:hypothetical protein
MSHAHAQQFLEEQLRRAGLPPEVAACEAGKQLAALVAAGLVPVRVLEAWERDAHIYHLRGQRLTVATISVRLSLHRATVFEAIRRHQKARRAALRVA